MAVTVVDQLEMIDIENHDHDACSALRQVCLIEEGTAVEEPGERPFRLPSCGAGSALSD
jgi:hypothetical protein